jgi:hypothetical protein
MKYYKITKCSECPACEYVEYKGWSCNMMQMPLDDMNEIPDWCPLEDVNQ